MRNAVTVDGALLRKIFTPNVTFTKMFITFDVLVVLSSTKAYFDTNILWNLFIKKKKLKIFTISRPLMAKNIKIIFIFYFLFFFCNKVLFLKLL